MTHPTITTDYAGYLHVRFDAASACIRPSVPNKGRGPNHLDFTATCGAVSEKHPRRIEPVITYHHTIGEALDRVLAQLPALSAASKELDLLALVQS